MMTWRLIVRASPLLCLFALCSIMIAISIGTQSNTLMLAYVSNDRTMHIYDTQHGFDQPLDQHVWSSHSPAWSPDGRYLVYVSVDDPGHELLYLLDTRDYSVRSITPPDDNVQYVQLRWTPDSHYVLAQRFNIAGSSRIVIRWSVETKQIKPLDIDHPQAQAYLEQLASNPSGLISPDGSGIVALMEGQNGTEVGIQQGEQFAPLQNAPSAIAFEWYSSVTWLPDNRFFLTTLDIREGIINTGWNIYIIDSHDEVPARLLIDGGTWPAPRP